MEWHYNKQQKQWLHTSSRRRSGRRRLPRLFACCSIKTANKKRRCASDWLTLVCLCYGIHSSIIEKLATYCGGRFFIIIVNDQLVDDHRHQSVDDHHQSGVQLMIAIINQLMTSSSLISDEHHQSVQLTNSTKPVNKTPGTILTKHKTGRPVHRYPPVSYTHLTLPTILLV